MTPTEHNSHLAGDLNAPRPQRSLLAQARLTDAEIDELDRLEGSAHPNWSFDDELKGIANAATRKAFEVMERWLRQTADADLYLAKQASEKWQAEANKLEALTITALADELHAQLQAQTEAQP